MNLLVNLADLIIEIHYIYPKMEEFCKPFIIENTYPDFSILWTEDEVMKEQDSLEETTFSPGYLETLTALRHIAEQFPAYDRLLMHGASISYGEKAYLFTAPSGTGKSTHIRLWKKYLGKDVDIVNGDKPFLHIQEDEVRIYGTPWAGKENWYKNRSLPLGGICFVQRGTENRIRRIEPSECLSMLFKQVYMPESEESAGLTLELMDKLVRTVPLYILECDISEDAVRCSFEAMTGLPYDKHRI